MTVEFTLNGRPRTVRTEEERSLLEVLREDLGLTGTKYGCGEGDCRACTVLIDGKPTPSCLTAIKELDGKKVLTIEGLADGEQLHAVQRAFLEAGALQCGYCVPGMILAAAALLERDPAPDDDAIVAGMNGNICRCCGYVNILEAVRLASRRKEASR